MAAKFTVPDAVREILARSTISADRVVLPDGQLDRKLYEQVNKALAAAGGKWNRSAKAHLFERDPREALGLTIETGKAVNERQAKQAFYTPDPLADRLVRAAGLRPGSGRILDPSCGEGALLLAARRVMAKSGVFDGFDTDERALKLTQERLRQQGASGIFECVDFLTVEPSELHGDPRSKDDLGQIYDAVIMNPPFTGNADVKHVTHAWKFLRPGGTLAAIMSPHWTFAKDKLSAQFREFVAEHEVDHFEIPSGTFEHTDIATVAIVLRRGE